MRNKIKEVTLIATLLGVEYSIAFFENDDKSLSSKLRNL